ncbi:hypothetical protein [Gordonia sp. N1V]|uniref:hypothetical protein n=1 Tax=Gordonia sp. N1V TaxID=3034163 RepID=UPI0023E2D742|nr:hypothetical protein [Gordonia sp. N1V]MDF3280899.1 hypothetical protein [Gordonia sp. N1V]
MFGTAFIETIEAAGTPALLNALDTATTCRLRAGTDTERDEFSKAIWALELEIQGRMTFEQRLEVAKGRVFGIA